MQLSILSVAAASSALAGNPTLWYVTRAAAISAYLIFALTAVLGLLRTTLRVSHAGRPGTIWFLDEAHQFSALLAVGFLVLHLGTLLLDPVVPFGLVNLIIPLNEPYQPLPTTLGVLALYTVALVALSSWFRGAIAYGVWRALHGFSFVAFALITLHGLTDGTDSGAGWMRLVYLGVTVVVLLFVMARFLATPAEAAA